MQPPYPPGPQPSQQPPGQYPPAGTYAPYPGAGAPPYHAPQPASSSNKGCWVAAGIVGGVLLLLLLLIGGCTVFAVNQANKTRKVEVILSGTGVTDGRVSIYPPGGTPSEDISPWSGTTETRTYDMRRTGYVSAYAYAGYKDTGATVTCEIKVEGRTVSTDTGTSSAHCSYTGS